MRHMSVPALLAVDLKLHDENMQSDGMMKDCPLVVNSNAAITKATTDLSDSAELPIADPPKIESPIKLVNLSSTPIQFLNRGPTYLRFCVFLI